MLKVKSQKLKEKFPPRFSMGITLIELIVYLAIMGVVLLLVVTLVSTTLRQQGQSKQNLEVSQNLRLITDKIASDISNATSYTLSSPTHLELTDKGGNTLIYELSTTTPLTLLYFKKDETSQPLTSSGVIISNLNFSEILIGSQKTIQTKITIQSLDSTVSSSAQISNQSRSK